MSAEALAAAPAAVETPADEAAFAAAVAEAAAHRRAVEIVGGGTRRALGGAVQADVRLSTAALDRVALYEPAALTLVAGAGCRLSTVEAMLAAEGQRLPFEPMDHRPLLGSSGESTLGGVVACNVSGPRRIAAGACRDSLIGVRFVDGSGRVVKNGGRVMKNVTGYDLVKLMAGSWGVLGAITEVAFKLLPIPETERLVFLDGLSDRAGVAALSAALGSPYDVTGAAHLPGGRTLIRIEGFETSVAYRAERLAALLAPHGAAAIEADPATAAETWRAVRDARPAAAREGVIWRVSVKPTDGPVLAERVASVAAPALYDWGGGLVWLVSKAEDGGAAAIRAAAADLGGHATLIRAPDALRAKVPPFQPEKPAVAALSAAIRARFDPAGVLNPGRMAA
ncbi:MAG: FAD-binding protein [Rhodobacteraceae bacterium]|nr:MAG: FAD-binding protein [Paracoccaceae bacterium]